MTTVIIGLLAFLLGYFFGYIFGGAHYVSGIRSGRVETGGRIYLCKDIGPVVRD